MTLSTLTSRISYPGAGSTGPFAYPFKIFADADLLVTKRSSAGVETILALTTDYTVTGALSASGTVTLTTALAVGETIVIRRSPTLSQSTSIRNLGSYFAATHEDTFDRLTMQLQSLQDQLDRSPKLKESVDPSLYSMAGIEPVANQVLAFNAAGTGIEARTVSDGATALPGAARTTLSLSDYLAHNAVFNVEDYAPLGVVIGVGNAVNDMAALAAAITAAGTTGLLFARSGLTLTTTAVTTLVGPTMMTGARINYSGAGIAVQVGDGTNIIADMTIFLPAIFQALKTGVGWGVFSGTNIGTSIGVKVVHAYSNRIFVPYVRGFGVGLLEWGSALGSAYNKFFIGTLINNKENQLLDGDVAGWVNENEHFGGRFTHDSVELVAPNTVSTGQPGTRQVRIAALASVINNHRWYGSSFEGDVPEFMVDCAGQSNLFDFCRYEAGQLGLGAHPKCRINGAAAIDNVFRGGLSLDAVVFTFAGGASAGLTRVDHKDGIRWAPATTAGGMILGNTFGSASPILTLLDSGISPHNYAGTDWSVQLGSRTLKGKASADAAGSPRITVDWTTGNVTSLGSVNAAGGVLSKSGSVVVASATFGTILTPTAPGRYLVAWTLIGFGGGNTYSGVAELIHDAAGTYIMTNTVGANTACQMSGANFQIRQSSGSSQTLNWTSVFVPF